MSLPEEACDMKLHKDVLYVMTCNINKREAALQRFLLMN